MIHLIRIIHMEFLYIRKVSTVNSHYKIVGQHCTRNYLRGRSAFFSGLLCNTSIDVKRH